MHFETSRCEKFWPSGRLSEREQFNWGGFPKAAWAHRLRSLKQSLVVGRLYVLNQIYHVSTVPNIYILTFLLVGRNNWGRIKKTKIIMSVRCFVRATEVKVLPLVSSPLSGLFEPGLYLKHSHKLTLTSRGRCNWWVIVYKHKSQFNDVLPCTPPPVWPTASRRSLWPPVTDPAEEEGM